MFSKPRGVHLKNNGINIIPNIKTALSYKYSDNIEKNHTQISLTYCYEMHYWINFGRKFITTRVVLHCISGSCMEPCLLFSL